MLFEQQSAGPPEPHRPDLKPRCLDSRAQLQRVEARHAGPSKPTDEILRIIQRIG
jgi:hypothetical protein